MIWCNKTWKSLDLFEFIMQKLAIYCWHELSLIKTIYDKMIKY